MDRVYQGIGSGSYLDADRVDRLVDQLVRTLNGGLLASALAPGFKVPNSYMKENGAVLFLRMPKLAGIVDVSVGILPVAAPLLSDIARNRNDLVFSRFVVWSAGVPGGALTAMHSFRAKIGPQEAVLSSVDGRQAAAGDLVSFGMAGGASGDPLPEGLCVFAAEHVT